MERETLEWCMKANLLLLVVMIGCTKKYAFTKAKGTVDGYEWRCRSQSKDNPTTSFGVDQIKILYEQLPNLACNSSKKFIKLSNNDFEEYRSLSHALVENKDYEFYVNYPKLNKQIKGLPTFPTTD
ncbi:hypothetical protein TNCV_2717091 [Trichonephila clavipes]|nr:hypothetical protein TNCV_2717091 [Trichonephila clavipes]